MQGHGHPSYKWVQDIPYALRTIFKNYHLHQGSSCHLTISIASSGLHDLCKVIRVFIKLVGMSARVPYTLQELHNMSRASLCQLRLLQPTCGLKDQVMASMFLQHTKGMLPMGSTSMITKIQPDTTSQAI